MALFIINKVIKRVIDRATTKKIVNSIIFKGLVESIIKEVIVLVRLIEISSIYTKITTY